MVGTGSHFGGVNGSIGVEADRDLLSGRGFQDNLVGRKIQRIGIAGLDRTERADGYSAGDGAGFPRTGSEFAVGAGTADGGAVGTDLGFFGAGHRLRRKPQLSRQPP